MGAVLSVSAAPSAPSQPPRAFILRQLEALSAALAGPDAEQSLAVADAQLGLLENGEDEAAHEAGALRLRAGALRAEAEAAEEPPEEDARPYAEFGAELAAFARRHTAQGAAGTRRTDAGPAGPATGRPLSERGSGSSAGASMTLADGALRDAARSFDGFGARGGAAAAVYAEPRLEPAVGPASAKDDVKRVQGLLTEVRADRGQYALKADGLYGPQTRRAVSALQAEAGLPVTGLVDEATGRRLRDEAEHARSLNAKRESETRRHAPGDETWLTQRRLNSTRLADGLEPIPETGVDDEATTEAMKQYARKRGLGPRSAKRMLAAQPVDDPVAQGLLAKGSEVTRLASNLDRKANVIVRRLGSGAQAPLAFMSGMQIDADGSLAEDGSEAAFGHAPGTADGLREAFGSSIAHERGREVGTSQTSLRYKDGRSLNPLTTPYCVLPLGFEKRVGLPKGSLKGAVMSVSYGGRTAYAVVGDYGPARQAGECSVAVALRLGIPADPVRGGREDLGVIYTVFPGTGSDRPAGPEELAETLGGGPRMLSSAAALAAR
ncbi:MAG: peptidoglycan-binding protein [Elusimicrobia bacterium]|nr:peptidoglycan-binding protein [Elusimicrobiota bacterium]